jgi:multidrug efflux pump subunit AcrA (membrane-fusion protein)
MEHSDDIEIYSEPIRDFLEKIPSWLIRWGTSIVFVIVFVLFVLSYFIDYPDIVKAPLKLTSLDAPKPIIARATGKLQKLFIENNQEVKEGQILGYVESTTNYAAVLEVEKKGITNYNLGELQPSYQIFDEARTQYLSFKKQGLYKKRRELLLKDLVDLKQLAVNTSDQIQILQKDLDITENEYNVNKKLLEQKVIAPLELRREESKYLAKKFPLKSLETTLINNSIAQTAKQKELLDLDKTISEQENLYLQAKKTFQSNIDEWKKQYLLIAPSTGKISFSNLIQERVQVEENQELFNIIPIDEQVIGTIQIPQENFGKVKEGQKVIIKFNSYPFHEFGIVEGRIIMISLIPNPKDESYMAKISFPKGLQTSYNKQIKYHNGMKANAEIITEDMKLIVRILYNLKKVFER